MQIWRWTAYVILLPLTPIFLSLLILCGQVEASATIEEVLGGTELFFAALVVMGITLRDVEIVNEVYVTGGRFDLMRTTLLLATCFVAMSACFAFIHDRVFDLGLDQRYLAAYGTVTILLVSTLCITAQAKLATLRLVHEPYDKPKRVPSALE